MGYYSVDVSKILVSQRQYQEGDASWHCDYICHFTLHYTYNSLYWHQTQPLQPFQDMERDHYDDRAIPGIA